MMVAVSLAACSAALIGAKDVSGTSTWFNAIWKGASVDAYAQHVLMLGSMDLMNSTYIPVVWSLKWEMWVSLLLPLVLLLARQRPLIIVSLGTLSIGWYWTASPYSTDVFRGLLRYLPMFVLGAVLSHHRQALTVWVTRLNDAMCAALLLLALLIIPVQWYGYAPQPLLGRLALNDYAVLLGAALLIVLALGWKRWQLWLERPGLLWLGRVSFSLYLYHALVLAVVVRLGAGLLPLPVLILTAFALTLGVAHLGYEYVERRAIERGRATTRPFRRNQA